MRARATWTPRPAGAKRLNCGSLRRLTDGMISPTRARVLARWGWVWALPSVIASIWISPSSACSVYSLSQAGEGKDSLHPQPRLLCERRPVRQLLAQKPVHTRHVEVRRHQRLLGKILLDARRMDRLAHRPIELLDDRRRQALRRGEPEPGAAVHVGIAGFGEGRD